MFVDVISCYIKVLHFVLNREVGDKGNITRIIDVQGCSTVNYLEHVVITITLDAQRRGDVNMILISPMGTRYTLLI